LKALLGEGIGVELHSFRLLPPPRAELLGLGAFLMRSLSEDIQALGTCQVVGEENLLWALSELFLGQVHLVGYTVTFRGQLNAVFLEDLYLVREPRERLGHEIAEFTRTVEVVGVFRHDFSGLVGGEPAV